MKWWCKNCGYKINREPYSYGECPECWEFNWVNKKSALPSGVEPQS